MKKNKKTGKTSRGRPPGMVWIPGGTFQMGSDDFYPEERPAHSVPVRGFWMDAHTVTVEEFAQFVAKTGYVTTAERELDASMYPDADPSLLHPGSLVFRKASGPVDMRDVANWWAYELGANWRRPEGTDSSIEGRETHPVTHVAYEDACAYAAWSGKTLPTEAEWEFAARGGLHAAVFPWGNAFTPNGKVMANTWQGEFPWQNTLLDGFESTSPVGSFPPNGYGLYDMAGNVWEWTSDLFSPDHSLPDYALADAACPSCVPAGPFLAEPDEFGDAIPRRVIKGGSHLCAPNYCLRYRPAARQAQAADTSTCHLGFRCILRP